MLYRFLIFYLFGFGNSFIIHKTDVTKVKLKNSFDEMPSSSNDYYEDNYINFKKKVDSLIKNHDINKENKFIKKFKGGKLSFNEIRFFIQQYSVFYNLFLETKLKKINNANSIEDIVREKEVFINELGVIYNNNNLNLDKKELKISELEVLKNNGFLLIFSEITGAVSGIILKITLGNSNIFVGYSMEDDKTFKLNNNLYSLPKGTIDGGTYKFEASQFEWLHEIAMNFNLNYSEMGKRKLASNTTLHLCNSLDMYYANHEETISIAAEYAMNYWRNTSIWKDIIIGFQKYNKNNKKSIPLIYWHYNDQIKQTLDLKEKFDYNKIKNQELFLRIIEITLDSLLIFWNGLIKS